MTGGLLVPADVLLDACCLINLASSGCLPEILRAVPNRWHLCAAVASEMLMVDSMNEGRPIRSPLDLQPWLDEGLLLHCAPTGDVELATFVSYAARLDDGEAMCLALAKCRSWIVATDERKGRRIATQDGIHVLNTVQVMNMGRSGVN